MVTTHTALHDYLIWEDEVPSSAAQSETLVYLHELLAWLIHEEGWFCALDLACFHPAIQNSAQMIIPHLAVFKGIVLSAEQSRALRSWEMRGGQPCPPVVMEVSSTDTWKTDVGEGEKHKPVLYGRIGVREYFAFDPNEPSLWGEERRVRGWRYDAAGVGTELQPDNRGWLWSEELASWVGMENVTPQLYDGAGRRRLTKAEAAEERAQAETQARQQAEAALQQAESQMALLRQLLREQGIEPPPL